MDELSEMAIVGMPFINDHAELIDLRKMTFSGQPCVARQVTQPKTENETSPDIAISRIDITHLRRELKKKKKKKQQ